MIRIITLEREYGCGGAEIAARLAQRLGWKLWDQQLTQEIATAAQVPADAVSACDERMDSRLHRLAKVFWRGSYERSLPVSEGSVFDADCMMAMMDKIMARIAAEGNAVIVGRGAPYFLRDREDTMHVFTYAPKQFKIQLVQRLGKSQQEAEELVEAVDTERIAFVKHYFAADWPSRALYHLMVNTKMGLDNVINMVLDAKGMLEKPAVLSR